MSLGMLGKYERLDILGHGASGIVYLAQDTLLKRRVALKEINSQGEELQRVLEEARVLDRLRHPNIVAIHGVDTIDGKVVIDMEYVQGSNLLEILRKSDGPLPVNQSIAIAAQTCDALAYAHALRTVHRDIKPANILVTADGEVKLADFGLALVLGSNSYAGGAGTFAYMAPEDFAEDGHSDRQSDLWAVGVILYEMLTGRRPFTVQNPRDPFAWSRAIAKDEIKPPSFYQFGIPQTLDEICLKALQRDKRLRYADAASMADDLRRVAAREPLPAISIHHRIDPSIIAANSEQAEYLPVFLGASDIDTFLEVAPDRWAEVGASLDDGTLADWLERIGEPLLASAAVELRSGGEDTVDVRVRDFLYRAGLDIEQTAAHDVRKGSDLIADRRFAEAVECLQRAINLDPAHPSYHRLLAQAALQAGDIELTREALLSGLLHHPNDKNLKQDLAAIGGGAPELSKSRVEFGTVHHGEARSRQITLHPSGASSIKGTLMSAPGWLTVNPSSFNSRDRQSFTVLADSSSLADEAASYNDTVILETSAGLVEFSVSISVQPTRPEFSDVVYWYLPVLFFCLLPLGVGELTTAILQHNGSDLSLSPAALIGSGLLFAAFLAINFSVDTGVYERIAAAAGILLTPFGIYQVISIGQHSPDVMMQEWQPIVETILLCLCVPSLQAVAFLRAPKFLDRREVWIIAVVVASSMTAGIFWQFQQHH